jgi:ribosomal 50S subunit-recycling heat shock protein
MRLDKYLKVSRLVKRRTLAKELCDSGRVEVNGRPAKAGTEIQIGNLLKIRYGSRIMNVKVEKIVEQVRKEHAAELYQVLGEERIVGMTDTAFDEGDDLEE